MTCRATMKTRTAEWEFSNINEGFAPSKKNRSNWAQKQAHLYSNHPLRLANILPKTHPKNASSMCLKHSRKLRPKFALPKTLPSRILGLQSHFSEVAEQGNLRQTYIPFRQNFPPRAATRSKILRATERLEHLSTRLLYAQYMSAILSPVTMTTC